MKKKSDIIELRHQLHKKFWKAFQKSYNKKILRTISYVQTSDKVLALTFDDGPHPNYTLKILDILKQYNAKATFFIVGSAASKYKKILARMADDGHAIGNHGWSHTSFPTMPSKQRRMEIVLCEQVIHPFGCGIFRAPYGHLNAYSRFDLFREKLKVIGWNYCPKDWLDNSAEYMFENIKKKIRPGSIILLHDSLQAFEKNTYEDRKNTCQLLKIILNNFCKEYNFITVPKLLKSGKTTMANWRIDINYEWLSKLKSSKNVQ